MELLIALIILVGPAVYGALQRRRRLAIEAQNGQLLAQLNQAGQQLAWWQHEFGGLASKAQREQQLNSEVARLEASVRAGSARLAQLQFEVGALEERSELQASGFYQMRYDFGSLAEYEARLEKVRNAQEWMIKSGTAATCSTKWHVDGDRRAGEKMTRDFLKLVLRAFNGTCDTAVARVKFNNVTTLEKRINVDFDAINKLSVSNHCALSREFLGLKLEELQLAFEYQDRKQREQEEQRAIREQMREEERAQREIERAKEDAEKEERRYQTALDKARREADAATGKQRESLELKIAELSARLADATALKQRAISQAQLTSAGHVYVISNIGSFGDDVYKIGMTRRLDPMDRVWELGDASVPFQFDVHAMIYTENAPELERLLHQRFTIRRVNRINERKEFFRVTIDEVERAAREIVARLPQHRQRELVFTRTAAAEEFRRSCSPSAQLPPTPPVPNANGQRDATRSTSP